MLNMSSFIHYALLSVLLCLPVNSQATQGLPVAFKADYSIYRKGAKIAKMQRRFSRRDDGYYVYRSETRTTGLVSLFRKDRIVEETTWTATGGDLYPSHYTYDHTGGKKDRHVIVDFDWDNKVITNSLNGASWEMPAQSRIMDKLLYQLAIMKDLKAGRRPLSYTIADGGKIKPYHFEVLGEETIKTHLGQFKAIKLKRHKPNSRRQSTLWCVPALDYLPVRLENIEKDGQKTRVEIRSLVGIPF